MFEKVNDEKLQNLEALARRVREELSTAGLPVVAPGSYSVAASGAEVDIDDGADATGGVYVGWVASAEFRESTSRAFQLWQQNDPLLRQPDEPVLRQLRHSSAIAASMMEAMAAILTSAGFAVQDADDEYRSHQLRVTGQP